MGMKSKEWDKLVAGKACKAGHVGLMVPDVIWNMGNGDPRVRDFEDVWRCRECGEIAPMTEEEAGDPGVRDFEDVWRCRECGEIVPMTEKEARALNGLD